MKWCSKCGQRKSFDDFGKDKNAPDGKFRWCKDCSRANSRKWYKANQDSVKERVKNRRANDPEYYQKQLASNKRWQQRNPDICREQSKRTNALRRGATMADLTVADWQAILKNFDNKCAYCSTEFTEVNPAQQDHMLPVVRGGSHTKSNIVPACRRCNRAKGNRTVMEFMAIRAIEKRFTTC